MKIITKNTELSFELRYNAKYATQFALLADKIRKPQIPAEYLLFRDALLLTFDIRDNGLKQDFFDYFPPSNKTNILVIGNPPFGRVSSLAIKFFNYSAKWANVIAFIIPRTFRKTSIQNKLNNNFHLIYDEEIPNKPCCFSPIMMVKCCF